MRKLDHDQRRLEIAEVAARLIAADGMEALTTRSIARAMGCSIGVLSHYFDSKAGIVTAAFAWASARIEQRLARALARGVSIDNLLPLIEAALPHDRQSRIEWGVRLQLWSHAARGCRGGRGAAQRHGAQPRAAGLRDRATAAPAGSPARQ